MNLWVGDNRKTGRFMGSQGNRPNRESINWNGGDKNNMTKQKKWIKISGTSYGQRTGRWAESRVGMGETKNYMSKQKDGSRGVGRVMGRGR